MANVDPVYNTTTTATEAKSNRWFNVPNPNLQFRSFFIKIAEVILSFLAFVLEEVVKNCTSCAALYFFEFVSCTAFLFTLLLLILLSTQLHQKVGITCWPKVDFVYTVVITVFLFIASIAFAANNNQSDVEKATVAFGFLAFFVFFIDVVLFYREKGFPFSNSNRAPAGDPSDPERETMKPNGTSNANVPN